MKGVPGKFVKKLFILFLYAIYLTFFSISQVTEAKEEKNYQQLLQEAFRTELVYPQEQGIFQMSIVPSYLKQTTETNLMLPFEIEVGITNFWQFEVFGNTYLLHHENEGGPTHRGIGDLGIGTKYSFMNINHSTYSASFNFEYSYPAGNLNQGLTTGFALYEPSISLAKDFPAFHQSQLFGQVGFALVNRIKKLPLIVQPGSNAVVNPNEPAAKGFFLNIGYFLPLGITRYIAELNWETNKWNHNGKENNVYVTPGLAFEVAKDLELAAGGSVGLTHTSDRYDVFLRATIEFA